jgi:hypothetical protein
MNDHLISNEVVVMVQASGESINHPRSSTCAQYVAHEKKKNWMKKSQNMKWFGSTKWLEQKVKN